MRKEPGLVLLLAEKLRVPHFRKDSLKAENSVIRGWRNDRYVSYSETFNARYVSESDISAPPGD